MTVRAKLKLTSITLGYNDARQLEFTCQYDDTIEEDRRFCKATPNGTFDMYVDNPAALEQFELGKDYYVDFIPVPE